eukprot:1337097-Pleurochrysis_carterae.AAC.1
MWSSEPGRSGWPAQSATGVASVRPSATPPKPPSRSGGGSGGGGGGCGSVDVPAAGAAGVAASVFAVAGALGAGDAPSPAPYAFSCARSAGTHAAFTRARAPLGSGLAF